MGCGPGLLLSPSLQISQLSSYHFTLGRTKFWQLRHSFTIINHIIHPPLFWCLYQRMIHYQMFVDLWSIIPSAVKCPADRFAFNILSHTRSKPKIFSSETWSGHFQMTAWIWSVIYTRRQCLPLWRWADLFYFYFFFAEVISHWGENIPCMHAY
jgi:hypothetical protein